MPSTMALTMPCHDPYMKMGRPPCFGISNTEPNQRRTSRSTNVVRPMRALLSPHQPPLALVGALRTVSHESTILRFVWNVDGRSGGTRTPSVTNSTWDSAQTPLESSEFIYCSPPKGVTHSPRNNSASETSGTVLSPGSLSNIARTI